LAHLERTYKTYKSSNSYKGIQANLKIPTGLTVSSGNSTDYLIWYVGFTDADGNMVEGGINYTKKYDGTPKFGKFLNGTGFTQYSSLMTTQPQPGDIINIKLVNNGDSTASLYIAGNLVTTKTCPGLDTLTQVKLIHGTEGNNCLYENAEFQNAQYKSSSDVWTSWTSSYSKASDTGTAVDPITVITEFNPMKTSAR